ncbi:MAG: AAA family ATPase [Chitinophagaceae bacterium]|nr:MAG: AAA family ATPase [Chitinophagaceae bacterium]
MIYLIIFTALVFGADGLLKLVKEVKRKLMKRKQFNFFEHEYIESKGFYAYLFNKVPVVSYIQGVDPTLAYKYLMDELQGKIENIYQHLSYNRDSNQQEFTKTFIEAKESLLVEIGTSYVEILYRTQNFGAVQKMITNLAEMKLVEKKQDFEINIITQTSYGLELKALPICPTDLDIALYYNNDFTDVDALLRQRLNTLKDKGIVLLHGLPGTGKTTYLRYLIGKLNKRVLFMSPAIAGNLTNPEFIELLLDNPNCVLVIEDAENIIMDRRFNSNSAVANLLNIGDGLLSDCLSVQIICTFNNSLASIDSALRRKGRLIAEYEFRKLTVEKGQALSDHLKLNVVVKEPLTLAQLTNADTPDFEGPALQPIGFRRQDELVKA